MFLNFLGFSIVIPILPFLVQHYAPDQNTIALHVGLLISVYALCQFIAAPGLGALSDLYGRRPILLISLFGSVIGYVLLGVGGSLWILFLGRIIDGLTGGNTSTVYAYMADITKPKERGKYYGMLGAAGGFGFMFGPAIGGFTAHIFLTLPLFLAAGVTLVNMVWGYFVLPESLPKEHKSIKLDFNHLNPFQQFSHIFEIIALKRLFSMAFLFFLAFNAMYGNASVYLKDVFSWSAAQIGILLFVVGLMDIFSQGYLLRKLLSKFGEMNVIIIGTILSFIGLFIAASTSFFVSTYLIYLGVIILIIGYGLFEPSTSGMISNAVGPKMQGRVQGANQGMQSIARVFGPLLSAFAYQYWRGLPYSLEALLVVGSFIVFTSSLALIKSHKIQS